MERNVPGRMPRDEGGSGMRETGGGWPPLGRGTTLTGRGGTLTGAGGATEGVTGCAAAASHESSSGSSLAGTWGSFSSPISMNRGASSPHRTARLYPEDWLVAHDFVVHGAMLSGKPEAEAARSLDCGYDVVALSARTESVYLGLARRRQTAQRQPAHDRLHQDG